MLTPLSSTPKKKLPMIATVPRKTGSLSTGHRDTTGKATLNRMNSNKYSEHSSEACHAKAGITKTTTTNSRIKIT